MYLPNYWTKLMLLSYLLVWLWSWYFWYFPLESENMRSALVRFLPCLPFSFCASWVSSLALKKYQACAKKTKRMEKCSLRVAKYQTLPEQSKWSCISQCMLGPGLPLHLCSRQERKYLRGFNTSGKIRNFIWAVSFTETGSHNRCRGIVLFDLPHEHKRGWFSRTGMITWSWLHRHRKL